ncbi:hypothetical protein F5X96DRAFT_624651 [Biscogniauxia mediterranea]|nr:hypothetical protein F5X96DRAFT_624651 [Biscogniauxia mediterranea]
MTRSQVGDRINCDTVRHIWQRFKVFLLQWFHAVIHTEIVSSCLLFIRYLPTHPGNIDSFRYLGIYLYNQSVLIIPPLFFL